VRLSWNEVRVRATAFAEQWRDAADEVREAQSFYNDFFQVFDVERRSVARYEEHVRKLDDKDGFIDLFWPGVLLVEQKSAGRSSSASCHSALCRAGCSSSSRRAPGAASPELTTRPASTSTR